MNAFSDETLRALVLLGPAILCSATWLVRPVTVRIATGAMVAFLWLLPSLLLVNILAAHFDWWHFRAEDRMFFAVPVDIWLGWALFWGPFCVVAFDRSMVMPISFMAWIDLLIKPSLEPLLVLGPNWLIGQAVALGLCLVPALVIARLTVHDRRVHLRGLFHIVGYGGIMFWVLPAAILHYTGHDYAAEMFTADLTALCLLPFALALLWLGVAAVFEFAHKGDGTPIPFDPPKRLVTTGPYAYLANPMQVSSVGLLIVLAIHLNSAAVGLLAFSFFIFAVSFVPWHNRNGIALRFGEDWQAYRARTPNWIPQLKMLRLGRRWAHAVKRRGRVVQVLLHRR